MADIDNGERLARLRAWLEENGADLAKLELRASAHGNGVFARAAIGEGEEYARIPRRLAITEDVCRGALPGVALTGRVLLCTFLVHQRFVARDRSFWKPYLDILPDRIPTALCFAPAELALLKGTPMEHVVADRLAALAAEHRDAQRAAAAAVPAAEFGLDRYLWAASVVSSRGFGQSMGAEHVLLPLLDMMNHRPLTRVTWVVGDDSVAFAAGAAVGEGAEVVNNYGAKSNDELLLGYGFCAADNPCNRYHIRLNNEQDPQAAAKQALLDHAGAADRDHFVYVTGLPPSLMPMLRVMVMTEVDVYYTQQQLAAGELAAGWTARLGLRIELRARLLLAHLLRTKLQALRPVDAVDTPGGRLAMQYRGEIRAMLQAILARVDGGVRRLLDVGSRAFAAGRHMLPGYMASDGDAVPPVAGDSDDGSDSDDASDGGSGRAAKRARTAPPPFATALLSLDSLGSDDEFAEAIEQVDVEEDVLLTLFVLRCRMRPESPWHAAVARLEGFSHPMLVSGTEEHVEMMMDMGELHDTLFPLLSEHFPDVFPPASFTPELFLWAAGIVEACRLCLPAALAGASSDGEIEGLCLV